MPTSLTRGVRGGLGSRAGMFPGRGGCCCCWGLPSTFSCPVATCGFGGRTPGKTKQERCTSLHVPSCLLDLACLLFPWSLTARRGPLDVTEGQLLLNVAPLAVRQLPGGLGRLAGDPKELPASTGPWMQPHGLRAPGSHGVCFRGGSRGWSRFLGMEEDNWVDA